MAGNNAAERLSSNSVYALELEGVGRQFGALVALADINLRVGAGERRAILGSNGAGKTTLFNAVTGDFPPTAGRIKFFGEDITAFPVQERIRRGLRRTYQISQLFGGLTVIDSIFVACRGVSRRRLSLLRPSDGDATMAQARSIAHSVHLDDILETPVSVLSHGQQRQLEIALALSGAPRFILFDEPAAGLSPSERRDLVAILNALPPHIGYIIIEHDLDVALRVSTYVTMMHNGRIFTEGTPEEIENDAQVQAIYLGAGNG
jgi:branched-chain amino acid transport system ATP-binding protein